MAQPKAVRAKKAAAAGFRPYVSSEQVIPELTLRAIVLGVAKRRRSQD